MNQAHHIIAYLRIAEKFDQAFCSSAWFAPRRSHSIQIAQLKLRMQSNREPWHACLVLVAVAEVHPKRGACPRAQLR
jgi:hypothetical protein